MKNLLKSITTVGGYTMLYRVMSVVRDSLQAHYLGASVMTDIFTLVFHLANITRKIFAEGSLNASFLPKFVEVLKKGSKDSAAVFASQVFTIIFIIVATITIIWQFFFPEFMQYYASKFYGTEYFKYAVEMGSICLYYIAASFMFALFSGVLNGLGKFAIPTSSQVLLNVFIIAVLVFLPTDNDVNVIYNMCYATSLAGVAQVIMLWTSAYYNGVKIKFTLNFFNSNTLSTLKRVIPGAIGCGVWPINTMVDMIMAAKLNTGAASYLYYTDHVNQLVLSVLGIALGVGVLPHVANSVKRDRFKLANVQLNVSVLFGMMVALPLTAVLIGIAPTIISVFYESGEFGVDEVLAAAPALSAFAAGIPAYILSKIFSSTFFAQSTTKIASIVGIMCIILNFILIIILSPFYKHIGIAIATTISAWFNAVALYVIMAKEKKFILLSKTKIKLVKQISIAVVVGGMAICLDNLFEPLYVSRLVKILMLLLLIAICEAVFYWLCWYLRCFKESDYEKENKK